ncbi:MAG: hypothetical protein IJ678_09335, partial [Kiritimatiellae bacterium]|nr:hypothetical protein [Kiritimatiellia bacterium]
RTAAAAAVAALAFAAALAGCESSDSYSISVSPGHASVRPGQSVAITASGWGEYVWTLDTDGAGSLSAHKGETVVFTAASGVSNATVKVTASAVGSGGSSSSASQSSSYSSTNSVSGGSSSSFAGYTATAVIEIGG